MFSGAEHLQTSTMMKQCWELLHSGRHCELCVTPHKRQAVQYCYQCHKYTCKICATAHAQKKIFTQHFVGDCPEDNIFCRQHEVVFDYFCRDCQKLLCVSCVTAGFCDEHDVVEMAPLVSQKENEMNSIISQLSLSHGSSADLTLIDMRFADLEKEKEKVQHQMKVIVEDIIKREKMLVAKLESHQKKMLDAKEVSSKRKSINFQIRKVILNGANAALASTKEHLFATIPIIKDMMKTQISEEEDDNLTSLMEQVMTFVPEYSPKLGKIQIKFKTFEKSDDLQLNGYGIINGDNDGDNADSDDTIKDDTDDEGGLEIQATLETKQRRQQHNSRPTIKTVVEIGSHQKQSIETFTTVIEKGPSQSNITNDSYGSTPTNATRNGRDVTTPTNAARKGSIVSTPTNAIRKGSDGNRPTNVTRKGSDVSTPTNATRKGSDENTLTNATRKGSDGNTPTNTTRKGSDGNTSTNVTRKGIDGNTPTNATKKGGDGKHTGEPIAYVNDMKSMEQSKPVPVNRSDGQPSTEATDSGENKESGATNVIPADVNEVSEELTTIVTDNSKDDDTKHTLPKQEVQNITLHEDTTNEIETASKEMHIHGVANEGGTSVVADEAKQEMADSLYVGNSCHNEVEDDECEDDEDSQEEYDAMLDEDMPAINYKEKPTSEWSLMWCGLKGGNDVIFLPSGDIAVTDTSNKAVLLYTQHGECVSDTRQKGVQLHKPFGLAYHHQVATLLVTDRSPSVIHMMSPDDLSHRGNIWIPDVQLPCGLGVLSDGRIAVCDGGSDQIFIFSQTGQFLSSLGGSQDQFSYPRNINIDPWDHIIIADSDVYSVKMYNRKGHLVNQFEDMTSLSIPRGLCTDHHGNILVVSGEFESPDGVSVWSPEGHLIIKNLVEWSEEDQRSRGAMQSIAIMGSLLAILGDRCLEVYIC